MGKTNTVVVKNKAGIHARPSATIVKTANQFSSDIVISKGDTEANARDIMSVLTLGASCGTELTVTAEGEDAEEALNTICDLLGKEFNFDNANEV